MAEEKKENEVNVRRSDSPSSADADLVTVRGKRIKVTDEEFRRPCATAVSTRRRATVG